MAVKPQLRNGQQWKNSPKTADRLIELGYDSIMEALSLLAEDDLGEANKEGPWCCKEI